MVRVACESPLSYPFLGTLLDSTPVRKETNTCNVSYLNCCRHMRKLSLSLIQGVVVEYHLVRPYLNFKRLKTTRHFLPGCLPVWIPDSIHCEFLSCLLIVVRINIGFSIFGLSRRLTVLMVKQPWVGDCHGKSLPAYELANYNVNPASSNCRFYQCLVTTTEQRHANRSILSKHNAHFGVFAAQCLVFTTDPNEKAST